jgi:hypothetical protein
MVTPPTLLLVKLVDWTTTEIVWLLAKIAAPPYPAMLLVKLQLENVTVVEADPVRKAPPP